MCLVTDKWAGQAFQDTHCLFSDFNLFNAKPFWIWQPLEVGTACPGSHSTSIPLSCYCSKALLKFHVAVEENFLTFDNLNPL